GVRTPPPPWTGSQSSRLHRRARQRREPDQVAHGIDVRQLGLVPLVDAQPPAAVRLEPDILQPEPACGSLPADAVEERLRMESLPALHGRLDKAIRERADLLHSLAQPVGNSRG